MSTKSSNATLQSHALLSKMNNTPCIEATKLSHPTHNCTINTNVQNYLLCDEKQLHLVMSAGEAIYSSMKVHSKGWQLRGSSHELTIRAETVNSHWAAPSCICASLALADAWD